MKRVIKAKFQQHPYLKEKLLALNEYIVEDNTWNDKFWGRCNGKGENNLGKILIEVRQELKYPPGEDEDWARKEAILDGDDEYFLLSDEEIGALL